MDFLKTIVDIYENEENDFINENSLDSVKLTALYMFYHYYNADVTKLDEMNNQFCFLTGDKEDIIALNNNFYEENTIDFLTVLPIDEIIYHDEQHFEKYLEKINEVAANVVCKNYNAINGMILDKYNEFDANDDTINEIVILCDDNISSKDKFYYQDKANKYTTKNNKIRIKILFLDDILEEMEDVESPKNCVSKGIFELLNKNVSFFGQEKSFLGFISAKSLQKNYILYSTKGLFASNLRYYVKSQKIDEQIKKTILEEPENFCYYNNGIIVTCDDYKINDDELTLYNFSIVNGGQTTNLVGRSDFENDFPVMCKIIKNKYDNLEDRVVFLSKVAEASNTQKPIKAKDLIANRKEQRLLKIQFENGGIFLQVKRGEKIPKETYSEPWQNASNDQVAQMIFSSVYQSPGSAKNAKSKLLENEKNYNKIFKNNYDTNYFISLQNYKVGFNNWVKKIKKTEKNGSIKLGIAKNADLMTLAVIAMIYKILSNQKLTDKIREIGVKKINNDNEVFKQYISQNDIGNLNFFNEKLIKNMGKKTLYDYFEYLYKFILIPAYEKFKLYYPTYSYSNFVKSDMYYYNFVVPCLINEIINGIRYNFYDVYDLSKESSISLDLKDSFNDYKPGLEEELKEYRTRTFTSLKIKAYEIFKNNQLVYLIKYRPKDEYDLKNYAKFSDYQIERFGNDILEIIAKYSDVDEYMKKDGE